MYEDVKTNGITRWVVPLGVYHRLHRRGMQCCPVCLQDENPYYRLKWRTSIFTVCEKHQCFLIDECPNCKAKIEYHRLGIGKFTGAHATDLKLCSKCYYDLSSTSLLFPPRLPERIFLEYRNVLKGVAKNRWSPTLSLPTTYPLAFFEGLRGLLMLMNRRSAIELRKNINKSIAIDLPLEKDCSQEFVFLGIHERFKLLMACFWLMHDWPYRFVNILKMSKLSRSRFAEDVGQFPFWLQQPLNHYLDQRHYIPSPEEVDSIVDSLKSKGLPVNVPSVAKALGIGRDFARTFNSHWINPN